MRNVILQIAYTKHGEVNLQFENVIQIGGASNRKTQKI